MEYDDLKARIKKHEGFRDTVYLDSLGKRTVGYGHLCVEDNWNDDKKYSEAFLNIIFDKDFNNAKDNAHKLMGDMTLQHQAKCVLIEMVFQLGIGGVSKFKNMWKALGEGNYQTASEEMLDSRWAKQTPSRAEELSVLMKSCKN